MDTDLSSIGIPPTQLYTVVIPRGTVSVAALYIYDFFLTFDSEVELMWPSPWNTVKVLYVLTRYLPLVDVSLLLYLHTKLHIDTETCKRLFFPTITFIALVIVIAECAFQFHCHVSNTATHLNDWPYQGVLIVRTWAIWGCARPMTIFLSFSSVAVLIFVVVTEGIFLKTLSFSQFSDPRIPGCLLLGGSPIIIVNYVTFIVFDTFLLTLFLIVGVQRYRKISRSSGLVNVLYRDGILFYVYVLTSKASSTPSSPPASSSTFARPRLNERK
ncbi:hypothetical protein EIP91_002527 [Steccherinum ochraceum]|uniref:DUF6533 domain-containing protein n=1 Tax=Steccherinum ochraceum TaxID=92696 RepID=A0A4R0RKG1_9APHY|nr:hypothetical protein EIP91_002527 [Steccherinum ochraceum]